jgi:hypothetical protein
MEKLALVLADASPASIGVFVLRWPWRIEEVSRQNSRIKLFAEISSRLTTKFRKRLDAHNAYEIRLDAQK